MRWLLRLPNQQIARKSANEAMQVAGPPFVVAMARCLQRLAKMGPPMERRGGKMWPGTRKQRLPLGPANARGLWCASEMGQLYASTLRAAAIPFVIPLLGQAQHGARPHGGTEFPVMIRRFFLEWAKCRGISPTVLFVTTSANNFIQWCRRRCLDPCVARTSARPSYSP